MGSSPSHQPDPELASQLSLLRAYIQEQSFKKYELNKLRIRNIHVSSNTSYKDLKESKNIQKITQHKLQELHSERPSHNPDPTRQRSISLQIHPNHQEFLIHSLNSLEESLFNELFLQDKKSEQLKEKLSNLNKSLQRHQEKFKKNLNDLKRVVDKKSKLIHKKNVSEKFGDSTFFTSRTAGFTQISAAGDQGLSNSLSNIKGLAYLKPEITDLKGKMLLRDELKDALELYSKNYEKKIIKIQELKNKLEKSPADEIFDGKFTESELKLLKNRIFILEKEVENEKSELGFLKNISMIGQRFQDFQDRDIDMLERVYCINQDN